MGGFSDTIMQVHFEPFFETPWVIGIAVIIGILTVLSVFQYGGRALMRMLAAMVFVIALLNPSLLQKQREAVKDVAVVVVDQSMSQNMGERQARTKLGVEHIQNTIGKMDNIDLRVIYAPDDAALSPETRLFDALQRELADVPQNRRAGVVIISDGQVHDVPKNTDTLGDYGPIHVLLTGERDEKDRRIDIVQNPAYGIVGKRVKVTYKIDQTDTIKAQSAAVTLNIFDGKPQVFNVPIGEEQEIEFSLDHAGENIFELSVAPVEGEITEANNRAAIRINGVRDRLKVLLVSGRPHAGGRTWRDLLTSDPGVDLVHFTILREPEKLDATPQNELALIAFPFRELFEVKLYDFDLIIFDRYKVNRILPQHYFDNIASYVKKGGALLEASGPSFAGEDSIFYTDIGGVLPAIPDGNIVNKAFKPHITKLGVTHPVTEDLIEQEPLWGSWLRQISLQARTGDTLMSGYDDKPLLILDRVGEGRVAQIASDHIWLWSRGYDGGGPHAELLRRTVHWLMKEPALDERALKIDVDGQDIRIRSRETQIDTLPLSMTTPDGQSKDILLTRDEAGFLEAHVKADQLGIYAFSRDGGQKRFVVVGEQNPLELRDVLSTDDKLLPATNASGGGVIWLEKIAKPAFRSISSGTRYAGDNWLGLKNNNAFSITSVKSRALLPSWAWLVLVIGVLLATWWYEGRRR